LVGKRSKMEKDKIITYWSGKKLRYRKDGKPDMRYTLGRKEAKKATPKRMPVRHEFSLWGAIKIGLVFGALVALIMVLQAILDRPNRKGFLSPVVSFIEVETPITNHNIDEVVEQINKYDWDSKTMVAIAKSENGYKWENSWSPERDFTENTGGSIDRGILMINSNTFSDFMRRHASQLDAIGVVSFEDMTDIGKNIAMAYLIYQEQGLNAWTDHRNGRFLEYIE